MAMPSRRGFARPTSKTAASRGAERVAETLAQRRSRPLKVRASSVDKKPVEPSHVRLDPRTTVGDEIFKRCPAGDGRAAHAALQWLQDHCAQGPLLEAPEGLGSQGRVTAV